MVELVSSELVQHNAWLALVLLSFKCRFKRGYLNLLSRLELTLRSDFLKSLILLDLICKCLYHMCMKTFEVTVNFLNHYLLTRSELNLEGEEVFGLLLLVKTDCVLLVVNSCSFRYVVVGCVVELVEC